MKKCPSWDFNIYWKYIIYEILNFIFSSVQHVLAQTKLLDKKGWRHEICSCLHSVVCLAKVYLLFTFSLTRKLSKELRVTSPYSKETTKAGKVCMYKDQEQWTTWKMETLSFLFFKHVHYVAVLQAALSLSTRISRVNTQQHQRLWNFNLLGLLEFSVWNNRKSFHSARFERSWCECFFYCRRQKIKSKLWEKKSICSLIHMCTSH